MSRSLGEASRRLAPLLAQILLFSLILNACAAPERATLPTAAPPAVRATANRNRSEAPASQVTATAAEAVFSPAAEPAAIQQAPGETPTPTVPAQPSGAGLRPSQALLLRQPETGPEAGADWRPPPVAVPHALHPDDHYWLARPIPSDKRNYDLEWYPYGNQPLRRETQPYRVHHGMDFPNEKGTPVFAASSGTVVWAGPLPSARNGVNYYGNTVVILHDWQWLEQPVYTLYAHTLELFVEVGDEVEQGQLVAGVGASGEVSGPHLHLEVRVGENNYNNTRNPALWLAPYEGWGVLAGRFMDDHGQLIHGALVNVTPVKVDGGFDAEIRTQRTYAPEEINSDELWQENFVVADLPAGEYKVVISTAGQTFRRTVHIHPGMTNYIIVQADFDWSPTPTPTFTPLPLPPATISTTWPISPTISLTPEGGAPPGILPDGGAPSQAP